MDREDGGAAILFRDLFVELSPQRISILRDLDFYESAIEKWPENRSYWMRVLQALRAFARYGLCCPQQLALLELLERRFGNIDRGDRDSVAADR